MRKLIMSLVAVALLALLVMPVAAQDDPGTIVDIAAGNEDFETLVAAVEAAGLVDALADPEASLTVFAPTDDAFAAALDALGLTAEELLADTETLTSILLYHVVEGAVFSTDLSEGEVTTLNGAPVTITLGDTVMVNDATVVTADIEASNGVIHVIDAVLLPPADEEQAEEEAAAEEETAEEPAEEEAAEEPEEIFTGSALVRLAHFASDVGAVDIYINGQLRSLTRGFEPGEVTSFLTLPEGPVEIAVVPAGRSIGRAVIGPVEINFEDGQRLTLAAYGAAFSSGVEAALIEEDYETTLAETGTRLTIFHAIPDAGPVDILADGELLLGRLGYPGTITLVGGGTNDGYATVDVPAGTYDIEVVPNGQTGGAILSLPDTTLEAGTFYLIAAVGTADSPDVIVQPFQP